MKTAVQEDTYFYEKNTASSYTVRLLNAIAIIVVLFQVWHLFYFINRYSVDVPFLDQWGLYNAFFQPHGLWAIFSWQHGPHREGAGFFLIWAVNALTGWNQRAQCFAIGGVMLLAAITVLWLEKRLSKKIQWYTAIPMLIVLSLTQWGIYANTPNVSHGALPLLLILLLCISWTLENYPVRYASVLAINFLAIFTGFGVFVGIITPILILIDGWHTFRDRKTGPTFVAICAFICALASMGLFFYKYRFSPAVAGFCFPDPRWYLYPVFMAIEFGSSILPSHADGLQVAVGGVTIVYFFAILASSTIELFKFGERYHHSQVVSLLLGFSLLFSANASIGRLCLGLGAATASRYVPLLMPAFIGAYLYLRNSSRWKEDSKSVIILFAAIILCTVPLWHSKDAEKFRHGKSAWVHAYMLTGSIAQADAMSGYRIYPDPARTNLGSKLAWLRMHHYSLFRKASH